jgi:outer membrane protein assembly factor BamB
VYAFTDEGSTATCRACFDPRRGDPDIQNARFASSADLLTHSTTGNILNVLIAASFERSSAPGTFGKLYSLSPNGDVQWEYPGGAGWPAGFTASPAVGPGFTALIAGDDGSVHAVSQSGILQWSSRLAPLRDEEAPFAQSPVASAGAIYLNDAAGVVTALTADGQTFLWRFDGGSPFSSSMVLSTQPLFELTATPTSAVTTPTPTPPAPTPTASSDTPGPIATATATASASPTPTVANINSTLFAISKSGELLILDVRTGDQVPTSELQEAIAGQVFSSPAYSLDGYLVFGDTTGKLYALNGTSGISAWSPIQLTSGSAIRSSAAISGNGTIWIGADDGRLYRIGAQ